ncbi:unnamed protein product [Larinioides sclopetarius]|uniref:Uncharacterized protein n=1 Tax=Larinioides sclopetarius TaxID=280406 RepID=A0AAV2AB71_9ARAC
MAEVELEGEFCHVITKTAVVWSQIDKGRNLLVNRTAALLKRDDRVLHQVNAIQTRAQKRIADQEKASKDIQTSNPEKEDAEEVTTADLMETEDGDFSFPAKETDSKGLETTSKEIEEITYVDLKPELLIKKFQENLNCGHRIHTQCHKDAYLNRCPLCEGNNIHEQRLANVVPDHGAPQDPTPGFANVSEIEPEDSSHSSHGDVGSTEGQGLLQTSSSEIETNNLNENDESNIEDHSTDTPQDPTPDFTNVPEIEPGDSTHGDEGSTEEQSLLQMSSSDIETNNLNENDESNVEDHSTDASQDPTPDFTNVPEIEPGDSTHGDVGSTEEQSLLQRSSSDIETNNLNENDESNVEDHSTDASQDPTPDFTNVPEIEPGGSTHGDVGSTKSCCLLS